MLGKPIAGASAELKIKVAQIGPIQFELIEPGKGKSSGRDFLEAKGGSLDHIGFFVENIDKATDLMKEKG